MHKKIELIKGKEFVPVDRFSRSQVVEEIVSHRPGYFERFALPICLLFLLLMFGATWFVKYPEVVEVRARLSSFNAPKELITRVEGRLIKLFVQNNQHVKKGTIIGWMESTSDHQEVLSLAEKVDAGISLLDARNFKAVDSLFFGYYANLGELQQNYQKFILSRQEFDDYVVNGFFEGQRQTMEAEVNTLNEVSKVLDYQHDLTKQDLDVSEQNFVMNESLLEINAISKAEFLIERSRILNKRMTLPQLELSLLNSKVQIRNKERQIKELTHEMIKQIEQFRQELQSLKSALTLWKQRYVLISPIEGRLSFTLPLQENLFLYSGKLLGYVNPEESNFYAETYLPQTNFGRLDTGLSVQLRLDAYPYFENGFVPGRLSYISTIPTDSGFGATIKLASVLVTDKKKIIVYKTGLTGEAVIITNNKRLFNRIYENIFYKK